MKYFIHILVFCVIAITSTYAQSMVDFSLKDCSNNQQNLNSILDQGKVVIVIYEHRCGSCTQGSLNVKNVLNTYFPNNPNIVLMYLDNGGNSCQVVNSWITNNNLLTGTVCQYSKDYSSPYGTGMPVIVIGGGATHKKYLQANGVGQADQNTIHNALTQALAELNSDVSESTNKSTDLQISPYPYVTDKIKINYSGELSSASIIQILDVDGNVVKCFDSQMYNQNPFELSLNEMSNGIYFLYIQSNQETYIKKFIVAR